MTSVARVATTVISIHALLAESDASDISVKREASISIHALLAESDTVMDNIILVPGKFLSTLSLRRATSAPSITPTASRNFYPRSPCGERPFEKFEGVIATKISIHALLAESDSNESSEHTNNGNFYPRSPCGERLHIPVTLSGVIYFYPRSPCGERPAGRQTVILII